MGYKSHNHDRSIAFTIRLPTRCVDLIDQMIDGGVYSSRSECIRDIVRSALREGFDKKILLKSSK